MDPLTPLTISAAARSIKPLARGVSELSEFASVLASEMAEGFGVEAQPPPKAEETEALQQQARELLDQLLRSHDVAANPPLRINLLADGDMRLAGDHPRAAEIEELLNGNPGLKKLAGQLHAKENAENQLVWPAPNLTETGLPSYTMGNQRQFGG